ncbi:MAG: phosphatidylserine/phosphatidylglycerophosphate/cardiolipin synthase family protein [Halioglobus sp.]
MKRRYCFSDLCYLFGLALVITSASCINSDLSAPIGEDIPDQPILLALEASRGNDQYFLKYQRGNDIYYAAGDLKGRSAPDSPVKETRYQTATVETLEPSETDDWSQLTRSLSPIPILGVSEWEEFRSRIFGGFMPRQKNSGVAVSFERGDYFFFYDKKDRFRARRLIDKPPWYSVSASINLQRYFEKWQPVLQTFLKEKGLSGNEVLFNTGDLDKGSIPFIYVSTQNKLIVLIRYDELPEGLQSQVPASHLLQSLWHFVGSHTYAISMRPFTSVQSLFSLVSDTALETSRSLFSIQGDVYIPPLSFGASMDLPAWEQELDQRLGRSSSLGTLDFLVDGEKFFPRFIDVVTTAEESVDIRAYIFDNDDVALTIAELLKRRSLEGIDVRVLYDGLGTIIAGGETAQSLPESHRAPQSIQIHLENNSRVDVRAAKNTWLMGDHVKTMVIDHQHAFLGGMNIGREYRYDWHDLMVEITGPVVDEINEEFERAWDRAGWLGDWGSLFSFSADKVNQSLTGYPLRLIYTRPGQQEIFDLQRQAIRRSQNNIYIENAYFTDDTLLQELIEARRRGVDVRVIIPLETDRGVITRNIILAANIMLEHGIRIYIYPGFTHAKAAIYDGWACVGSANLDHLSLRINREINIATSEPRAVEELMEELFLPDFGKSRELTEPFPLKWNDTLIEMFGDYIF